MKGKLLRNDLEQYFRLKFMCVPPEKATEYTEEIMGIIEKHTPPDKFLFLDKSPVYWQQLHKHAIRRGYASVIDQLVDMVKQLSEYETAFRDLCNKMNDSKKGGGML